MFSLPSGRVARIAGQAAVLSVLVGGTAAYAANDSTVQLTVDGRTTEVSAFGSTSVEEVLAEADVEVGDRDLVAPSLDTEVGDGSEVVVRYARKLVVVVDGEEQTYWTTALTVDEALEDLDIRADGAWMSSSRSLAGSAAPASSWSCSPRRTSPSSSTARPARSPPPRATSPPCSTSSASSSTPTTPPRSPAPPRWPTAWSVDVDRIAVDRVTETVTRRRRRCRSEDRLPVPRARRRSSRPGTAGTVVEHVGEVTDGRRRGRRAARCSPARRPSPRSPKVVAGRHQGPSRRRPGAVRPACSPGRRPTGCSVWDRLAQCESGGNWAINTGNGYYGGLQFNLGTWRAYGGYRLPAPELAGDPDRRGRRGCTPSGGFNPWPACADKLGLR